MKKSLVQNIAAIAVFLIFGYSCSKNVEYRTQNAPPLTPAKADANAGTWKTLLLVAPDEIAVPAPGATGTPDYIAQVNEIKSWQKNMTKEEEKSVKYWSAGAILRWNEIMRELVAKYNLPPFQNPDNTYPAPNANNPLAYPYFPFANPPYACRAYAYVSAAQYDAVVAAYHYKQLYNRKAPYAVDSSVKTLIPRSELPSYPSEDAVIAGAAAEVLKMMFPGDQDFINKKVDEHIRTRLLAGVNVRSDLDAGIALGKAVAAKFVARARADRAGVAGGNPAQWKKMEDDAIARGEIPWYSLEVPKRPPMLPLFGNVRSLLNDSITMVSLRPGPPPSTNSELMKKETEEVYQIITKPTREQIAIVHRWADGVGTTTPPGHWNEIASEDWINENFSEPRWARNMALLNITLMDAGIVCWDTKYFYFNPRPTQLNPQIKTATGIPNFPAYISGHSTYSGAAAAFLGHVLPRRADAYMAMAEEAALSRMYGGIHYRSDSEKGLEVGINVGQTAVDRAKIDGAE